MAAMKKSQFAVIGLGRFGSSLAVELVRLGYEVLGIDKNEEAVEEMSSELTHVVTADTTEEDVLKSIGIRNFDVAVVAIGDDIQSSILTAILLKDCGVKTVVAKALSELHGKVLKKIGVDRVIFPERDMGIRVANQLVSPNLLDYIEVSSDYAIVEMAVPKRLSGHTISQIDVRNKFGINIVAITRKDGVNIAPTASDMLEERDVMVIIGTNEQISAFEEQYIL